MTPRQRAISNAKEVCKFWLTRAMNNDNLKIDADGYYWYTEGDYLVIIRPNGSLFKAGTKREMEGYIFTEPTKGIFGEVA